jgi:hypothetical protein
MVLDSELVVRTSTGPASVLSRTVSQALGGGLAHAQSDG